MSGYREKLSSLLEDELYMEYLLLTVDNNMVGGTLDLAVKRFACTCLSLVSLYGYKPENMSEDEYSAIMQMSATTRLVKKVLVDLVLNEVFSKLEKPVMLDKVYRCLFDSSYIIIPKDKRPKPDFMNLPVEV